MLPRNLPASLGVVLAVAVLGLAGLGLSAPAGATTLRAHATAHETTKPVVFTGKVTCAMSGAITAKPGLTDGGGKSAVLTLTAKLAKCTGSTKKSGVTITGAKVTATSKIPNNQCTSLIEGLPKLSGTITYSAKGGSAKATKFSFSNGTVAASSPITVDYPGSGGTATATGSFAGSKGSATAVIKQSLDTLLGECGTSSGASALTLTTGSKAVL